MSTVHIRRATIDDIDALMVIERDCFCSDLLSYRQMKYLLTRAKTYCLAAESNHVVAGYAILLTPVLSRPARLYSLAVLPAYRGMGIANKLMTESTNKLRELGFQRWCLEVDETNSKAIDLYQNWGFKITAYLPGYYENGHNGLRMQYDFTADRNDD